MLPWGAIATASVTGLSGVWLLYHRAYLRPIKRDLREAEQAMEKQATRMSDLEDRIQHLEDFERFLVGGNTDLDDGFLQELKTDIEAVREQQQQQHEALEEKVDKLLVAVDVEDGELFTDGSGVDEEEWERVSGGVSKDETH